MTGSPRALMPDYLRLIALFGIVVVNVQFIGFSLVNGFDTPIAKSTAEFVTLWLVDGLALYKSYALFSVMFGVGLGFLMQSAERKPDCLWNALSQSDDRAWPSGGRAWLPVFSG